LVLAVRRALVGGRGVPGLRPDDGRLVVACSGGPDSTALLVALADLRRPLSLTLSALTVDHGLRPAAREEAALVARLAASLDVPHRVVAVEVARSSSGRASMSAARTARMAALVDEARRVGASAVALAHTATDQAETLVDRLLRGAGLAGLAAMAPRRDEDGVALVRPLLDVTRAEVEAFVAARGLEVARDPTNEDRRYRRSRLRAELLPLLRRERPDADRALAELAARLRRDDEALDRAADELLARARLSDAATLDTKALRAAPPAIAARALRRVVAALLPSGNEVGAAHLDALLALLAGGGSQSLDLPGGLRALRTYDRLEIVSRPDGARVEFLQDAPEGEIVADVVVDAPGAHRLGGREVRVSPAAFARLREAGGTLVLRGPRRGDRAPGRSRTLADVFIDRKIPREVRARLPVLVRRRAGHPDEVLWVGFDADPVVD
jgi:tRNA(Ile)-lysidine synthase